jgi:hypothetical protein
MAGPAFRYRPPPLTVGVMAPVPTPSAQPDDAPDSYVGLSADSAEQRARERGWTTVRSLPPGAIITMEYLAGRLNFEVEGGRVIRCWPG